MRRGHRLHSIHGAEPDMAGIGRHYSTHRHTDQEQEREDRVWAAVQENDVDAVDSLRTYGCLTDCWRWEFTQTAIVEAVKLGNADMVTALVVLFATNSANPYQVGELATIVSTSSRDSQLVIAILDLWLEKHSFEVNPSIKNITPLHWCFVVFGVFLP